MYVHDVRHRVQRPHLCRYRLPYLPEKCGCFWSILVAEAHSHKVTFISNFVSSWDSQRKIVSATKSQNKLPAPAMAMAYCCLRFAFVDTKTFSTFKMYFISRLRRRRQPKMFRIRDVACVQCHILQFGLSSGSFIFIHFIDCLTLIWPVCAERSVFMKTF